MTTLSTGLTSNHRATVAEFRKTSYVCNGWDSMQRWDGRGSSLETAGIDGPSTEVDSWQPAPTTAAGSCTVGVHLFRYRYMDSRTGYVSDPSEEREVEVTASNEQLTFPISTTGAPNIIRSTDSKVDKIIVEMTLVGANPGEEGEEFFKAAEVLQTASSVVVSISDPQLELQILPWPVDGHRPPPVAKHVVSHRSRLWIFSTVTHEVGNCDVTNGSANVAEGSTDPDWRVSALGSSSTDREDTPWFFQRDGDSRAYEVDYYDSGGNQIVLVENYAGTTGSDVSYKLFTRANAIWVSRADYPEGFEPLKFLTGPQSEMSGDITAGVGYGSSMIFYSLNGMFKLSWDQGPLIDPILIPLSKQYGALNQHTVIEVEGQVYSMDRLGWSVWSGTFPQLISRPVDALRSLIDYDQAENFSVVFYPDLRAIRWFVVYSSDGGSYPRRYVQLDVDTQTWSTGRMLQGISAARLVPTSTGPKVLYGDENGHVWFADQGTTDGCNTSFSHLTTSSASGTIVNVTETLSTNGVGLAGCYAYQPSSQEYRLISSNTATTITLASGFTADPVAQEVVWIGPIPAKLKTGAIKARKARRKRRNRDLQVTFEPESSTRYLQVRAYEDRSSTPKTWRSGGTNLAGLVWPGGDANYPSTDWLVDLSQGDGHVQVPLGQEWARHMEVEIECWEPDATVEILGLEIDGTETGDEE